MKVSVISTILSEQDLIEVQKTHKAKENAKL